jgi:hypothetical protein
MADVFSTVAGALSVAALFNNCVDCFEYVQLARHFGRDYERCQLKVDIVRTRLSRWGMAVAVNEDSRFTTASPVDASTRQIQSILEEIELLFQAVHKTSKRYELSASQDDLVLFNDGDMQPVFRRLHQHLGGVARQRQKHTNLAKQAAWALYDGKNFDRLIEQITGFVDDLERICPVEAARHRLVRLDIEEVDDEPALAAISDAAADVDSDMAEAAARKAQAIRVRNHVGKISTEEKARVRIGNEFVGNDLGSGVGIAYQTTNTADTVDAKGESGVHIGNRHGGQGVFGD